MTIKPILANFDLSGLPEVLDATNKRVAENERRRFGDTVANWDEKPVFNRKVSSNYGEINDYQISTTDKKYLWVDKGTDDHEISPNGAYALKIRGGMAYETGSYGDAYNPKTSAEKLLSDGSGTYTNLPSYGETVTQSIEPRNFTQKIVEKAPERWIRALNTEIQLYIKRKIK